ncbi:MAG TPA: hypothetical protein VFN71_05930 [Methylomirabilota bacterium]|nr:hypothetical protein [Methylomirabilota bacterium]
MAVAAALGVATVLVGLAFFGKVSLGPRPPVGTGTVFYVVAYHYGFVFYDSALVEREAIEVKAGETVTLFVVPGQALPEEVFLEYAGRSLRLAIGGLPPGDPRIREKMLEDLALGNVEHIIGIAGHPVYLATQVATVLQGERFRRGGPATLAEAIRQKDPAIKSVTFTAKKVGAFDVICVDSGMEGTGTCGWGHKWMVAKGALVVRP